MKELEGVNISFSETLKNADLNNLSEDWAEILLDSVLKEGFVKDIPIVGSIFGIGRTAKSIKDTLFLKKLIFFLSGISKVPPGKRKEMIDSVNSSDKHR